MKYKLFLFALSLSPMAVQAGIIPLPNSPTAEAPWRVSASSDRGPDLKHCVRTVGRGFEHGLSTTAHAAKSTEHAAEKSLVIAAKTADHAIVRTGEWIAGS